MTIPPPSPFVMGLSPPSGALELLSTSRVLALDLETCSGPGLGMTNALDPRSGRIRLLSLAGQGRSAVIDLFEHHHALPSILDALGAYAKRGGILVIHNALYDLSYLYNYICRYHGGEVGGHADSRALRTPHLPATVDTMLLAQLLTAGEGQGGHGFGGCGLQDVIHRYTGKIIPKELQASDWSGPLTSDQVEYARRDVTSLIEVLPHVCEAIDRAGLQRPYLDGDPARTPGAADVELRALPAFVWLAQSGVPFDRAAWVVLAERAAATKQQLAEKLDQGAPPRTDPDLFGDTGSWNWDSPQQAAEVFAALGHPLHIDYKGERHATTNDAALALCEHPLADVLRDHRHQSQLVKMYGANWLDGARIANGRLYTSWRQIGTVTGRTSDEKPNLQQVPRDAGYKACFRAPPGRVLVKADYATLQMRIACLFSRDVALLNVFAADGDPHTATAQRTLGKQEVSKAERQIAKSQNFALLFGAGSEGLRIYAKTTYGITFTDAEARKHRNAWLKAYPGITAWHASTRKAQVMEVRAPSGRRRKLHSHTPDTERLNSPVQALEADGMKLALALLWERRGECPSACPVLAVHDEIVLETEEEDGERVKAWLTQAMMDGMTSFLAPVPCKVNTKVCQTWEGE